MAFFLFSLLSSCHAGFSASSKRCARRAHGQVLRRSNDAALTACASPSATSGADSTFATHLTASPRSECQIQKLHSHYDFASGPLILTFARDPAAKGCEC